MKNPNPENYVVEEGELLTLTSATNQFNNPEAENLFVRNERLPRGDWDITVAFKAEFRTGRDALNFGLRKGESNYLQAMFYSHVSCGNNIVLRLLKVSNGARTHFDTVLVNQCSDTTALVTMIEALSSDGAAVTLSKRGRSYFASVTIDGYADQNGDPIVWSTDRLTSLRSPGNLTLGISKYETDTAGEVLIFVGRIEAVAVEGAE